MYLNIKNNILQTIHHLRTSGYFVLYTKEPKITEAELNDLGDFLEQEYENEVLEYPFEAPKFNRKAAVWAAKLIYFGAQFLVHRKTEPKDLKNYFPECPVPVDVAAILSADLSLRYVPFIITELEHIDMEDWLIKIIKLQAKEFQYATIGYDMEIPLEEDTLKKLFENDCFKTLYINRVIEKKAISLTEHTLIHEHITAHLGEHQSHFWKAFVS